MLDKTFLKIWSECIVPISEGIFNGIPEEERLKNHATLDTSCCKRDLVFQVYSNARNNFKRDFFKATKSETRIDCHKITACIVFALTKVHLIVYDRSPAVSRKLLNAKYVIAVSSAVNILYTFAVWRARSLGDTQLLNDIKSHAFVTPKTNVGHDGYLLGLAKSLILNDYYWEKKYSYWDKSYLDVCAYSNIFFWLEQSVFCQSGECMFK